MAWSYDPLNVDLARNRVRLLLGDTDPQDEQLQDEEIDLLIELHVTDEASAAAGARALAFRYARLSDKWVGDLKILASQKSRAYRELAEHLETQVSHVARPPFAGGIRVSQKESIELDTDLVQPHFRRGMFDYEGDPS